VERTYLLARPAAPAAPLIVALHGLGGTGLDMAGLTGLARRGPAAGFAVVFPDGWRRVWADGRPLSRSAGIDDGGFLAALVDRLCAGGVTRPGIAVLTGISNGALFAERLVRSGRLHPDGLVLCAGTALTNTRRRWPRPATPTRLLCMLGTADPLMPFEGGRNRAPGLFGTMVRRRAGPREGAVAAMDLIADWVTVNGVGGDPEMVELPRAAADPATVRLHWTAPGRPDVTLYRIDGGGHGWPGGPQYLPPRWIGRIPQHLDGTGLVLAMAAGAGQKPEGRP
jgi:polyhydroxybutyrate depolymerase